MAVFREPANVFKPFESTLGIEDAADIRQGDLAQMGLPATPTLLLVTSGGTVQNLWRGQLSEPQEKEVFNKLGLSDLKRSRHFEETGQESNSNTTVGAKGLKTMMIEAQAVVLDTRKRADFQKAHISGSLNIPYDEVGARAAHELPRDRPILLFCRYCAPCESQKEAEGSLSFCTFSDQVLEWAGFRNIKHISDDLDTLAKSGVPIVGQAQR